MMLGTVLTMLNKFRKVALIREFGVKPQLNTLRLFSSKNLTG
jgi:hypothetical protein